MTTAIDYLNSAVATLQKAQSEPKETHEEHADALASAADSAREEIMRALSIIQEAKANL